MTHALMHLRSSFVSDLDRYTDDAVRIIEKSTDSDLEWVSANRDFGEDERYRAKEDVDASLLEAEQTTAERGRIEACFEDPSRSLADRYQDYVALLDTVLAEQHALLLDGARHGGEWSSAEHAAFWRCLAPLAARDNAHAMYLSSGNWDFSVFNPIIDLLEEWTGNSPELYAAILTAGVQDIRTSVYSEFGNMYAGLDRPSFVAALRQRGDWKRDDGVLSLLCYTPATKARGSGSDDDSSDLLRRFNAAVETLANAVPSSQVRDVVTLYRDVYLLRRTYDTYEYFGSYGFLRNIAIHLTSMALSRIGATRATEFSYRATTYQFLRAQAVIKEETA